MTVTTSVVPSIQSEDLIPNLTEIGQMLAADDNVLHQIYSLATGQVGVAPLLVQLASLVLAVVVGLGVSKYLHYKFDSSIAQLISQGGIKRIWGVSLQLIAQVSFSLVAGLALTLFLKGLQPFGVVGQLREQILVQVVNQILFAWAILLVILAALKALVGGRLFSDQFARWVRVTFWIVVVLQIIGVLSRIVEWMQTYQIPLGSDKLTIWALLIGLITVLLTVAIANRVADACEATIMRNDSLEMNLRVVFARLCRVILLILALLIALSSTGINLTVLSVFGGALGVGIGFGMQKIASNYISGFIILFDRSLKIGDLVEVAGFSGVVTQINTRYSVIRNTRGEELIVPNENFVTEKVKNFSLSEREMAVTVDVSCSYESDLDRALEILRECVKAQPRVLKNHEPWVIVNELAASGINLRAGFWVPDPQNGTGVLKSNIVRDVLRRYKEENIEVPYNKLDVTMKMPEPSVVSTTSTTAKA